MDECISRMDDMFYFGQFQYPLVRLGSVKLFEQAKNHKFETEPLETSCIYCILHTRHLS